MAGQRPPDGPGFHDLLVRHARRSLPYPVTIIRIATKQVLRQRKLAPQLFQPNLTFMKLTPLLSALTFVASIPIAFAQPYLGNGMKIGETTDHSTMVWVRLTERAEPNWEGLKWIGTEDRDFDVGELGEKQFPKGAALSDMEGSLMGAEGSVRISWWPENRPNSKSQTDWLSVDPNRDCTRQVILENLEANQRYELEIESRSVSGKTGQSLSGSFRTALGADASEPFRFVISTCQSWITRDKGTEGLQIYDHMLDLNPAFFAHMGDIVYYDKRSAGGDVDALTPEFGAFTGIAGTDARI